VRRQAWCPKCAVKAAASRKRLTVEDMRETARQFGGEFLETEFRGIMLKVRCACFLQYLRGS
ncbi:unnamed protein product, partial [Discosporangium mesarthrocarpum]